MDVLAAKRLAQQFIEAHIQAPPHDRFVIVEAGIKKNTEGWYFPFQTERFVKTKNLQYSVVGNWPIFVSKTGNIVEQRRISLK